jgi:uncharacterized protein (TIGR02217 family)
VLATDINASGFGFQTAITYANQGYSGEGFTIGSISVTVYYNSGSQQTKTKTSYYYGGIGAKQSGTTSNIPLTNFGFSIPTSAVLDGIEVQYYLTPNDYNLTVSTSTIQLLVSLTAVGTAKLGSGSWGDSTDLWGTTSSSNATAAIVGAGATVSTSPVNQAVGSAAITGVGLVASTHTVTYSGINNTTSVNIAGVQCTGYTAYLAASGRTTSDCYFPLLQGLMWDVKKTPLFNNFIQTPSTLRIESRVPITTQPQMKFDVSYEFLRQHQTIAYKELNTLEGFFHARLGNFYSFLLDVSTLTQDTADAYTYYAPVSDDAGNLSADGVSASFQLMNTRGSFTEVVDAVDAGSFSLYVNNVLQSTSNYSLNAAYGWVTFTPSHIPAAKAVVTWSGHYYYRVRFNDPSVEFSLFQWRLWECQSMSLLQVCDYRPLLGTSVE